MCRTHSRWRWHSAAQWRDGHLAWHTGSHAGSPRRGHIKIVHLVWTNNYLVMTNPIFGQTIYRSFLHNRRHEYFIMPFLPRPLNLLRWITSSEEISRALLTHKNKADAWFGLPPAQMVCGRPVPDFLPFKPGNFSPAKVWADCRKKRELVMIHRILLGGDR